MTIYNDKAAKILKLADKMEVNKEVGLFFRICHWNGIIIQITQPDCHREARTISIAITENILKEIVSINQTYQDASYLSMTMGAVQ